MQQVTSTIQTFPDNLRGEIHQHLHKEFVNLPVFQYTSPAVRKYLALNVQRFFFTPDETLLFEGDYLENIYLVISGKDSGLSSSWLITEVSVDLPVNDL